MAQFTRPDFRELAIYRWTHRKTPPLRTVVAQYTLVSRRYGELPLALEVRPDRDRTKRAGGRLRWIAEFGMPSLYIDIECFGLPGATPEEAANEALQRMSEFLAAVIGA